MKFWAAIVAALAAVGGLVYYAFQWVEAYPSSLQVAQLDANIAANNAAAAKANAGGQLYVAPWALSGLSALQTAVTGQVLNAPPNPSTYATTAQRVQRWYAWFHGMKIIGAA